MPEKLPPKYMLFCETCKRKTLQTVSTANNIIYLTCENKHTSGIPLLDAVMCFTEHCEAGDFE